MNKEPKTKFIAAALLIPSSLVNAQFVIPNSSSTVTLQTLDPTATDFVLPEGGTVNTSSGNGINGDSSRDWKLVNRGSITAAGQGVFLDSASDASFENFGTVTSRGDIGVRLAKAGEVINHEGATITGSRNAVHAELAGVTVRNDGNLVSQGDGRTGIYFTEAGQLIQGATGRISAHYGVIFNAGTLVATNAGVIEGRENAVTVRGGANGDFNNTGGTIATLGTEPTAAAVLVQGGALKLRGGLVTAAGNNTMAVRSAAVNSAFTGTDLDIRTTGSTSPAAIAVSSATTDGSVAKIELLISRITTEGAGSPGLQVSRGGFIHMNEGSITTLGDTADGMLVSGTTDPSGLGGILYSTDNAIVTTGGQAHGVRVVGTNTGVLPVATLSGGTVETSGVGAFGLYAVTGTTLTANNLAITTRGQGSDGATARGGATVLVNGGSVTTMGDGAAGLSTEGAGPASPGAEVRDAENPIVAGPAAANASLVATSVTVGTSGAGSPGVRIGADTSVELAGGSVTAAGVDSNAVQYQLAGTGTLAAADATLVSQQGAGIAVSAGTLNATLTKTSLTGSAALFNVTGGSTLNLTAETGSTLTGAALTEAGSTSNLVLRDSTWHVTGDSRLTSLNNDPSQVLFSAPVGGVYKTLTVNQYTGDGTIGVNTYLGGDGSPSDRLIIDGGTASGTSKVRVTNAGGPGLVTTANGIQVIGTINGGTTQAGAFALEGRAVAGPYEYLLYRGGRDGSAPEGWFLRSEDPSPPAPTPPDPTPPDPTPPDPTPPDPSPPAPTPPTPVRPLYRPEVAAYLANQRLSGQMFVHSLHDRRGEPQGTEGVGLVGPGKPGAGWLRMVGKWEGGRSQDGVFKTSTDAFLLQGGAELATWPAGGTTGRLHAGVMGSYGNASSDARAEANNARAKGKVEGWALGIYGTWYQNDETKHGAYADTWFQYGWFSNRVEGEYLPTVKYHASGLAVSGETGYAVPLPGGWVVEPQAQLIYVDYSEDDILEPNGTRVSRAGASGLLTRLGVRTHRTFERADGRKVQPYATVNWWYADTDSNISFNQVPIGTMFPRNRFEVKVGANLALNRAWSGWANVSGAWGQQDYYQYAVRAGVRYAW